MSSPSHIYVLAEDQCQKQFIYRFLVHAGFNQHQMNIEVSPSGQGSAEQWVRGNFARQTRICRAKRTRSLFILLDADNGTVQEHMQELDAALVAENQPRFNSATDRIARLISKWSIETWILFLVSNGVSTPLLSEDRPYKNSKTADQWSELIPKASESLYAWTRNEMEIPENTPDSLQRALYEIPRALPSGR
jgi:hypothetical protein